jgi:5-dehydro-2-deoxygluconokinase
VRTVLDLAAGDAPAAGNGVTAILGRCDLVVGTREGMRIAGGSEDLLTALRRIRGLTPATLVLRLGAGGCAIIEGDVPRHIDDAPAVPGTPVEVVNELGAADAFTAALLKGWLTGMDWRSAGRLAGACHALVAARHAAAAAMPTPEELEAFMSGAAPVRPDADPHLARLHRVAPRRKRWDDLCLFAFDHRTQFFALARDAGAPESRLRPLKNLLVRALAEAEQALSLQGHVGALIDDTYGEDALLAASGRGWWLGRPVEVPGSAPLELEGGRSIGSRLISWPREQVVKCLSRFHPDAPVEERLEEETQLQSLYQAVLVSGHELLLEVIPARSLPVDGMTIVRAMKRLYNIGIYPDWWKLEAPPAETWKAVDDLIAARDPWCRGVLLLGLEASVEQLAAAFRVAAAARSCRGFLVGRTIFREPSEAWLRGRIDDATFVAMVRANFEALVRAWREAQAKGAQASEGVQAWVSK